jgi:hypothetical protein
MTTDATTVSDVFVAQVAARGDAPAIKWRPIAQKYAVQIEALYATKGNR